MSRRYRMGILLSTLVGGLLGVALKTATGSASTRLTGPEVSLQQLMAAPCWHTQLSQWKCPDSTRRLSAAAVAGAISGATVTVLGANGRLTVTNIEDRVDAIFLTDDAMQRFLLPYYQRTDAAQAAALQRYLARP